ncbi:MAG: hypothetical protein Kow00109_08690 [Acidobacteriota bacterium]
MLRLYVHNDDRQAEAWRERLEELVLAHEVVRVDGNPRGGEPAPPYLVDGRRLVVGSAAISRYLDVLEREADEWRKFQSDACYLEDDGSVC